MPRASIVIPAHNAEAFIGATLESVFAQTFQDFECIVVDDGSTDNTAKVVKSFTDPRLSYYCIANSGGPARPRNIGLGKSQSDYIFMFDADDLMHPQKLELSLEALKQYPEADFLFTNYISINESGSIIQKNYLKIYNSLWSICTDIETPGSISFIKKEILYPALVKVNFIGTSSVVLRRSAITSVDCFNETLKNSDDRLFWILLSKTHNGIFLNAELHYYRIQKYGISQKDFIERAPSKISALKIARAACTDKNLINILNAQIAHDYASLAYAYWKVSEHKKQIATAIRSLSLKINLKATKLVVKGILYYFIKQVKRPFKDASH